MHYLSRICVNSRGWTHPTGDASRQETSRPKSFANMYGYGHEEWLFRSEWQVDGWQYGFLQGVNNSRKKLAGMKEAVDVTLYTCEPGDERKYVARINDLECLSYEQSDAIHQLFAEKGWIDVMRSEIDAVGGTATVLGDPWWVSGMLNVRFRQENVHWFPADTFAKAGDYVLNLKRYQFNINLEADQIPDTRRPQPGRQSTQTAPNQLPFYRRGSSGGLCTPEHGLMQEKLFHELTAEYPDADVLYEQNFVDITVNTPTERILYEIKSDLTPRTVLRLAIGQLLEYGFHSPSPANAHLNTRLVIVGRAALKPQDQSYLEYLREQFRLPLEYRVVAL